jgi:hypothetical protein
MFYTFQAVCSAGSPANFACAGYKVILVRGKNEKANIEGILNVQNHATNDEGYFTVGGK